MLRAATAKLRQAFMVRIQMTLRMFRNKEKKVNDTVRKFSLTEPPDEMKSGREEKSEPKMFVSPIHHLQNEEDEAEVDLEAENEPKQRKSIPPPKKPPISSSNSFTIKKSRPSVTLPKKPPIPGSSSSSKDKSQSEGENGMNQSYPSSEPKGGNVSKNDTFEKNMSEKLEEGGTKNTMIPITSSSSPPTNIILPTPNESDEVTNSLPKQGERKINTVLRSETIGGSNISTSVFKDEGAVLWDGWLEKGGGGMFKSSFLPRYFI